MRSLYEDFGLGRLALGLQTWPRTILRGNVRASDLDAENELLSPLAARWESLGLSTFGAATSAPTETAEVRFAALTAATAVPNPTSAAAAEPTTSNPVVILGRVPSALAPATIGSSTPLRRLLPYVGAATSLLQHNCSISEQPLWRR